MALGERARAGHPGNLAVIGLGPGGHADLSERAIEALRNADRIAGYTGYTDLVRQWLPAAHYVDSPLGSEVDRCQVALTLAREGLHVALVSSGDAGVYGMSGLVYELAWEQGWQFDDDRWPQITVIPGITAATAAAALAGAPLMCDFAVVSLSDLLMPWSIIERRLRAAAAGDFVIAIYNPMSRRRTHQLAAACAILLQEHSAATPVAIVHQAGRTDQSVQVTTLEELEHTTVDMFTTIIVGNSLTRVLGGRLVTPRGYRHSASLAAEGLLR
ncbi:MAG: precorrin-3B C(17)-methyltransferase [Chloroflexi bacterium]|nr:precorrin-3B C(17)-methyltransferase [Chloroflexota bacterium]